MRLRKNSWRNQIAHCDGSELYERNIKNLAREYTGRPHCSLWSHQLHRALSMVAHFIFLKSSFKRYVHGTRLDTESFYYFQPIAFFFCNPQDSYLGYLLVSY
jgi:hypothetical protein